MTLQYEIAPAVLATTPPAIPKARRWAIEYNNNLDLSASQPLIDLSQGVPKTPPHPSFIETLGQIQQDPANSKYGQNLGETPFRQAFANEINHMYRVSGTVDSSTGKSNELKTVSNGTNGHSHEEVKGVQWEDVAITTGCNMAFLTLLMTLCPPHTSEILIPLPTYFNHDMSITMQSVKPVYIPCDPDAGFAPDIAFARSYLESAFSQTNGHVNGNGEGHGTRKTVPKMIVLVTPSNPSGAVYSHEDLAGWYALAKEYKIALVLDETYRDFVDPEENGQRMGVPHRLFEEKDWRDTLISIGSFSKGYRIPGHRLGSIIASPELLYHITTVCDCIQICAPRPPQIALTSLLPSLRPDLLSASAALARRRTLFQETIEKIPGWKVASKGGYYAFVSFPEEYLSASSSIGLKRKRLGSEDVAKVLGLRCGVIVLPGGFFMPDLEGEGWDEVKADKLKEDRWLRFGVANVEDEDVVALEPRLRLLNKIFGME